MGCLDVRQGIVPHEFKIFIPEPVNGFHLRVELHDRQRARRAGELFPRLVQMIPVQVQVSEGVDEFPRLIPAYLRRHEQKQSVGGYVEGNSQEQVRAALVKLEGKPVLLLSRLGRNHAELEQGMTRRERHVIHQGHVPCADDVAPGPWIVLKAVNQSGNLVNGLARRSQASSAIARRTRGPVPRSRQPIHPRW